MADGHFEEAWKRYLDQGFSQIPPERASELEVAFYAGAATMAELMAGTRGIGRAELCLELVEWADKRMGTKRD
jgi:hypothetical protein